MENAYQVETVEKIIDPAPAIPAMPNRGKMLFRLSGLLLRQMVRDSRLTVFCRSNGRRLSVGRIDGAHYAISIATPQVLWEIVTNPDPGAGELYMDGQWDMAEGDLGAFITMMARNLQNMMDGPAGVIMGIILKKKLPAITRDAVHAAKQIRHHYDIGNDLYESFLDSGMNYSCAFFGDRSMSLRDAQLNKIRTTIRRLGVGAGMKVLDIGCGWGEACRVVARETGAASVTGVTLAQNQYDIARKRSAAMENPPAFMLEDYREHAARHKDHYDRIFSIGMFEHVGEENYGEFFRTVAAQLAPDGKALIHSIMNAGRSSDRLLRSQWLERYIFPGGRIPDLPEMIDAAAAAGLRLAALPYLQPPSDYAETLRRWRDNFTRNSFCLDNRKYDERFRRMWIFYFAMCEAMFDGVGFQVGQVVFERAI